MIDFSKLSGSTGGSSTPVGPTTPAPGLPDMSAAATPAHQSGDAYQEMNQQQVDALGTPWDRAGRGLDNLGQALFGRGNGSPLGGIPGLGDAVGAVGNIGHLAGNLAVVKPFEVGASVLSHIPLSWVPGGADDNFNHIGEWAKANDPALYQQWQTVNAASGKDVLGGGNLKADFNMEAMSRADDASKQGFLGTDPMLAAGAAGVGSFGGALSHAIQGFLGLPAGIAQRAIGGVEGFSPRSDAEIKAGKYVSGAVTRIEQIKLRAEHGDPLNEVEKVIVDHLSDGSWSEDHARDYLVAHGQSLSRDPLTQIVGGAVTDPLTYATAGAGALAKAGQVGREVIEAGVGAQSAYQRLAVAVADVQASPVLGPTFRMMRGMVDPLGVYTPKSSATRGLIDLRNGAALKSFESAVGHVSVKDMNTVAREFGKATEVRSATGAFSIDQASLLMAREARVTAFREQGAEALALTTPDDVIAPMMAAAPKDVITRLTDHILSILPASFQPEALDNLAGRLTTTLGGTKDEWVQRVASMSHDLRSGWHAITYKMTEKDLAEAIAQVERPHAAGNAHLLSNATAYEGKLPLDRLVLLTDNNIDNVIAGDLLKEQAAIKAGEGGITDPIAAGTKAWNEAARKYPAIADIGRAPGGKPQLDDLVSQLKHDLESGRFHVRAEPEELNDPALQPINDMLDRHSVDGKRLWNVGFRPEQDVAWGLKRDAATGRYMIERDPSISHVMDAVPGRSPYTDMARNVLGQIIGPSKAENLVRPVDSLESYIRTTTDMVSGRRVVMNVERRFQRTMTEAGLPAPMVKDIFKVARDTAGLDMTTIRGLRPGNLWDAVRDVIPPDTVLKDGTVVNVHVVMDHLLNAAEGDLRIMGLTSVLSQRMRNIARHAGIDPGNWLGQWTVTNYNKLRYSQPTFLIQRITDAPYFGALRGIMPMGGGALKDPALIATKRIMDNLGRTGTARDFAMDMPEYATRSNFLSGVRTRMEQAALDVSKLERIQNAPDTIIANNMVKQVHARLGQIVREALDQDLPAAIKAAPLDQQAEMLHEAGILNSTFADIRALYSKAAGRTLNDNEVGLKFLQEQMASARRLHVGEDGLDMKGLVSEGEWLKPNSIGEIHPIHPDALAYELGYPDGASLRKDVTGTWDPATASIKRGTKSIEWLEEKLREDLHAHPDYTARAVSYFGGTWESYFSRLAKPVAEGGLDISPHYAREAQDLIATWAQARGMDPWEYLSQVMKTNVGAGDIDQHMGRLMAFLQAGGTKAPIEEWTKVFRSQLDVSAQHTLLDAYAEESGNALGKAGAEAAPAADPAAYMEKISQLSESLDDGADADVVRQARTELAQSHGITTGHRFAPWGASHGDSRDMAAQSAHVMGIGGYAKPDMVKPYNDAVDGYLQGIADSPGSDMPLFSGRSVESGPAPKVGETIERPLTATTPDRSMAHGFSSSRDHTVKEPGYVFEFAPGTKATMHSADEFLTAGKFRVESVEDVPFDTYYNYPHNHPDAPPIKVVRVSQTDHFDPASGSMVSSAPKPVEPATFTWKVPRSAPGRAARPPVAELPPSFKAEPGYAYRVETPEAMASGMPERLGVTTGAPTTFYEGKDDVTKAIYRIKDEGLATGRHGEGGADRLTTRAIPPEQIEVLGADGQWHALPPDPYDQMFDSTFRDKIIERSNSGIPHSNPEVEGYYQQFSKWVQQSLGEQLSETTRKDLRQLVDNVPTANATPFNRTHALVEQLLSNKINLAKDDVFMLAEMATKRSVLSRSLNHPLFGMYPASYMWGKVLPQTVKFLAENPYGATYAINDVQRSIALQREYDHEFDAKMSGVDKSAGAFLAGYLTPSLPWESMQAQMSPMVRDLFAGKDVGTIFKDELATTSPARWFNLMARSYQEGVHAVQGVVHDATTPTTLTPAQEQGLNVVTGGSAPAASGSPRPVINGPTPGTGLAPILGDQLTQLQDVFR